MKPMPVGSARVYRAILLALAVGLNAHAGTFTSDFTQGVNTNYWSLWTSFPSTTNYTSTLDGQGVTFQRTGGTARESFTAGLSLGAIAMRKITTDGGGFIQGDFVVTMTYANLNNFTSSSGDFWTEAGNQLRLYLQRGDGGSPERVHVVRAYSCSRSYYGWFQQSAFQGSFLDNQLPYQGGQRLYINPSSQSSPSTLKMTRTNGVLSYYINDQQIGVGEGGPTDAWTTNGLWSVNLVLKQGLDAAHVGVTLRSCTISGANIKDNPPLPPVLQHVPAAPGTVTFGWDAAPGQAYQVQTATNLSFGSWTNLGNSFIAARSPVAVTNVIGADPTRFFRVKALQN